MYSKKFQTDLLNFEGFSLFYEKIADNPKKKAIETNAHSGETIKFFQL